MSGYDWKTARVVRDGDGVLWVRNPPYSWVSLDHTSASWESDRLHEAFGPLTPVLDADGLPVVRTVGDLTARHIGKRVRLDEHYDAKLETIFAHEGGDVSLNFTHSEGFAFGCSRTLDTPCEVLS